MLVSGVYRRIFCDRLLPRLDRVNNEMAIKSRLITAANRCSRAFSSLCDVGKPGLLIGPSPLPLPNKPGISSVLTQWRALDKKRALHHDLQGFLLEQKRFLSYYTRVSLSSSKLDLEGEYFHLYQELGRLSQQSIPSNHYEETLFKRLSSRFFINQSCPYDDKLLFGRLASLCTYFGQRVDELDGLCLSFDEASLLQEEIELSIFILHHSNSHQSFSLLQEKMTAIDALWVENFNAFTGFVSENGREVDDIYSRILIDLDMIDVKINEVEGLLSPLCQSSLHGLDGAEGVPLGNSYSGVVDSFLVYKKVVKERRVALEAGLDRLNMSIGVIQRQTGTLVNYINELTSQDQGKA
ncbi:MAG: hypothetical protein CL521_04730 [Actinobacteria bacterium]|nr:hypothetical protein [Actinomycetota bacterium]